MLSTNTWALKAFITGIITSTTAHALTGVSSNEEKRQLGDKGTPVNFSQTINT